MSRSSSLSSAVACSRFASIALIAFAACFVVAVLSGASAQADPPKGLHGGVAFLAREVPKWAAENRCFSCHNNGDAARALIEAKSIGLLRNPADRLALEPTLDFLRHSERWDANGPEGPFKDKKLARIQFAAALATLRRWGAMHDQEVMLRAARLVIEMQSADGSWEIETSGQPGSPTTYGQPLGTYVALNAILASGADDIFAAADKARQWFRKLKLQGPLDSAATLLAIVPLTDAAAAEQRTRALELIEKGQADSGGWGPFVNSPPEPFDTAVVVLALSRQSDRARTRPLIERGRKYLLERQLDDGSWPATTRPPGADSYAQRISTTAWAVIALMKSH